MKRRKFLATPALGALFAVPFDSTNPAGMDQPGMPLSQQTAGESVQQKMHPDFITYTEGIEYFHLGNGDIQGVIQYSPKDPAFSLVGFTIMNPERFCRKWSTFLYHPEQGFKNTRLGVTIDDRQKGMDAASGMYRGVKGYSVIQGNFRDLKWQYPDRIPVVVLSWMAGECLIEEEFFVPHEGPVLFRRITVKNQSAKPLEVRLTLSLYANFGLFDDIAVDEQERTAHAYGIERMKLQALDGEISASGRYNVQVNLGTIGSSEMKQATYAYTIRDGAKLLKKKSFGLLWKETAQYWSARNFMETGNTLANHLLNVSKAGMKSAVARNGRFDAGIWMYNMEWVSDQALALEAFLHCGMMDEAKVMMERNLNNNIGPDGRTIESSRWFGFDYTELNQNGMLLYAVWVYLCWTDDTELIKKYWKKIKLCADFPLLDVFRDRKTGLMKNLREFWERSDPHGVESGYEMAYQFWVSFGLEKAASVASKVGDTASAKRWQKASSEIKQTMLHDPTWAMIVDGHLIKRRKATGEWQQHFIPPDRTRVPAGSQLAINEKPLADPDAIASYPILFEFIDPKGEVAQKTLQQMETIWSHQWKGGGYPRYNSTSEDNPPSPWPLASMLVARAYQEAGDDEKVWRTLKWLTSLHEKQSGSWFERYGQSITPPMPPVGIVPWTWYEILSLFILNVLGFRPQLQELVIRPRLLSGLGDIRARFLVRNSHVNLLLRGSGGQASARVNGKEVSMPQGVLRIPYPLNRKMNVDINYH